MSTWISVPSGCLMVCSWKAFRFTTFCGDVVVTRLAWAPPTFVGDIPLGRVMTAGGGDWPGRAIFCPGCNTAVGGIMTFLTRGRAVGGSGFLMEARGDGSVPPAWTPPVVVMVRWAEVVMMPWGREEAGAKVGFPPLPFSTTNPASFDPGVVFFKTVKTTLPGALASAAAFCSLFVAVVPKN